MICKVVLLLNKVYLIAQLIEKFGHRLIITNSMLQYAFQAEQPHVLILIDDAVHKEYVYCDVHLGVKVALLKSYEVSEEMISIIIDYQSWYLHRSTPNL